MIAEGVIEDVVVVGGLPIAEVGAEAVEEVHEALEDIRMAPTR